MLKRLNVCYFHPFYVKMTSRLKKTKDIKGIVEQEFKFNNYSYDEKTDCPIPYISCVCKDSPIPTKIDGPDAGVRMRCLNEDCQLAKMLVHKKCFEKLEENLLKILTKKGSARGWTDVQRRSNLWEKKGQGLVGNMLLCHCGHGMMCLDVDFYKEKELEEQRKQLLAEAKQRKKKCNKKSKLPAVNISNNGPVAPELLQNDFIPHGNKGLNRRQTSHSTSTFMFQSDESDTEFINEQRNSTPPLKSMLIVDKPKPLASDRPKSKPDLESTPKPLLPFLSRKDKIRGGGRKSLPAPKSLIETPILPPMINRSCGPIYLKGKGGDTPKHVVGQSPAAQKVVNEKAKSAGGGGGGQLAKTATPTTAQIVQKGPQQQSRKTSTIEKRPLGLMQTPSIPVPTSKPESGAFYSLFDPGARSFNLGELLLGESRLPGLITQPRLFSHLI